MPAHLSARARLVRRQERLRRRRLRRLHRLGGGRAGACLPLPRPSRPGPGDHHHRRPRPAPDSGRLPRRPGLSMRLLHRRHDHDRGEPRSKPETRSRPRPERQSLPLHRLSRHSRCHCRCEPYRPGRRLRRQCPGPGRPTGGDRRRTRHAGHRTPWPAAHEAAARPARPCPHHRDRRHASAISPGGASGTDPSRRANETLLHRAP